MEREHMRVHEENKTEAGKVQWVQPDGPDDVGGLSDEDGDGRTKMGMNPDTVLAQFPGQVWTGLRILQGPTLGCGLGVPRNGVIVPLYAGC